MGSTAKKILAPRKGSVPDYGAVWTFTGSDCCSGGFRKEKGTQENNGQKTEIPQETDSYEEQMEKKLEDLLSRVEGVGQVRVMLTFEGSGERKVEKDKQVGTGGTEEETVYEESGSSSRRPYVTSESNPQVEGVLVIAEGGDKSSVKEEIIGAAQALFGIEPHKIKIMKMEVEETK